MARYGRAVWRWEVVEERFERETEGLSRSWEQHDAGALRDYLVKDVEDPRINVQSILTRHFLVDRLFADGFEELVEHELRFALVMNWVLGLLKKGVRTRGLQAVLWALVEREDSADGVDIPGYVSQTFSKLAMPNYICDVLNGPSVEATEPELPDYLYSTFAQIWREVLEQQEAERISVIEPACGSANDYRFIDSFGIAPFLDYTGFDLSHKNIGNARQMFPGIRFDVGNVLEIDAADDAFDYCFVHDLFEHLSVEAMEVAIGEVCRVTRKDLCVHFFNMYDGNEHVVRAVDAYHWNRLSARKTKKLFEQYGAAVEAVWIDDFLRGRFGCRDTHNKGAYTFLVGIKGAF